MITEILTPTKQDEVTEKVTIDIKPEPKEEPKPVVELSVREQRRADRAAHLEKKRG
jgi:hypothetical protein